MLYKSKLRGSFGRVYPISLVTVYLLCLVEAFVRWQLMDAGASIRVIPSISFTLMGVFFLVAGFIQLFRYRIWIYPVLGFFAGLGCVLAIFTFGSSQEMLKVLYMANLLVIVLFVLMNWPALSAQERYEANARRLFRLASELIEETADGYTERPFSAGKVDAGGVDLQDFSRFLQGKFIARTFPRDGGLFLAFSMNRSVLVVRDPQEVSYVAVSREGDVTVQIAEADYRQYRRRISFDQLCASMAGVFTRFLGYYGKGLEHRIIDELKTAR